MSINATNQVEKRLKAEMITDASVFVQRELENIVAEEAVKRCREIVI